MRRYKIRSREALSNAIELLECRRLFSGPNLTVLAAPSLGAYPASPVVTDNSGDIFGTTSMGGTGNGGTLFEIPHGASSAETLFSFNSSTGVSPNSLVMDSNGDLIGTTAGTSYPTSVSATLFEVPAGASIPTVLSRFSFASPKLVGLDSLGNYYLYTSSQITEISAGGTASKVLATANASNYSYFSMIQVDSAGNIFGVYGSDAVGGAPSIFEIPAGTTSIQMLYAFPGSTAVNGVIGFSIDSNDNIFGVYYFFGPPYELFELFKGASSITVLASLSSPSAFTQGPLTIGANDDLFGFGESNSGPFIGEYTRSTGIFSVVASFGTQSDIDFNAVTLDSSGSIYGTDSLGGMGEGSVFEVSSGSTIVNTLGIFDGEESSYASPDIPNMNGIFQNGVVVDSSGDLLGSTQLGGFDNSGTLFDIPAGTTAIQTLASYPTDNGYQIYPNPVIVTANGSIAGTTQFGVYDTDLGGTFIIASGQNSETIPVDDIVDNGPNLHPIQPAAVDVPGNFFGIANAYYPNGGIVYELPVAHTENEYNILATFNGQSGVSGTQYNAAYGVALDSHDDVYYATALGGADNGGALMEVRNGSSGSVTLVSFNSSTGSPNTAPILDSSGDIFGTTLSGKVYELPCNSSSILIVANLGVPTAGLTLDSNGDIFGTTKIGGAYNQGSVFEIIHGASTVSTLASFNGPSGTYPTAPVCIGPNGLIYGTTSAGGNGLGTIFSLQVVPSLLAGAGATVTLPSNPTHTGQVYSGLSIAGTINAWTGRLDITNNALDITSGSLSTMTNQSAEGYANGTWSGDGIVSSNAADDSSHLTAVGVIQNNQAGTALFTATNQFDGTTPGPSDILIKYTYYGDANLDGKVDGSDYSLIDNGYLNHLTGWFNGDFNYDGVVDGSDYALIDNAFNQQGASVAAQVAEPAAAIFKGEKASKTKPAALFSQVSLPGPVAATCTAQTVISSVADEIFASNSIDLLAKTTFAAGVSSYID